MCIRDSNQTGISIMKIEKKLDSGPIIKQVKVKIDKETTSEELTKKLADIGATALKDSIDLITSKKIVFTKQEEAKASYAKKIEKSEAQIDWSVNAETINCQIRAFSPKPGAWFYCGAERIKILECHIANGVGKAGLILDDKFQIACSDGSIFPTILQRSGRSPMYIENFLRGFRVPVGTCLPKVNF